VLDWLGQWFKGYFDVGPYMRDRVAYDGVTRGLVATLMRVLASRTAFMPRSSLPRSSPGVAFAARAGLA
jgi:hypothetical protein